MRKNPIPASIRLNVTSRDIKNGVPGSTASCPLARSATRLIAKSLPKRLRNDLMVNVGPSVMTVRVYDPRTCITSDRVVFLSDRARRFIRMFDSRDWRIEPLRLRVNFNPKA